MTEGHSFHQRRYLVDRGFQIKYTLLVILFSSIIFGVLGYKLYEKNLANTRILQIQNPDLQQMISGQDHQILYILAGFFLLQVASLFVLGILLTHRIAGPVYRVQKYLEEMAQSGEIKPLEKVRSQDEFHEFFDSLALLVDRLHEKSVGRKASVEEIRKRIASLPDSETKGHVLKSLEELNHIF